MNDHRPSRPSRRPAGADSHGVRCRSDDEQGEMTLASRATAQVRRSTRPSIALRTGQADHRQLPHRPGTYWNATATRIGETEVGYSTSAGPRLRAPPPTSIRSAIKAKTAPSATSIVDLPSPTRPRAAGRHDGGVELAASPTCEAGVAGTGHEAATWSKLAEARRRGAATPPATSCSRAPSAGRTRMVKGLYDEQGRAGIADVARTTNPRTSSAEAC